MHHFLSFANLHFKKFPLISSNIFTKLTAVPLGKEDLGYLPGVGVYLGEENIFVLPPESEF